MRTRADGFVSRFERGGNRNPHLDQEIRPLRVTPVEKRALVAFLRALSGDLREGVR